MEGKRGVKSMARAGGKWARLSAVSFGLHHVAVAPGHVSGTQGSTQRGWCPGAARPAAASVLQMSSCPSDVESDWHCGASDAAANRVPAPASRSAPGASHLAPGVSSC